MKRLALILGILILPAVLLAQSSPTTVLPTETCPPFGFQGNCGTPQHITFVECYGYNECHEQVDMTVPGSPNNKCEAPVPVVVPCCDTPVTVWVRGDDTGGCLWASVGVRRALSELAKSMGDPAVMVPSCTGEYIPLEESSL